MLENTRTFEYIAATVPYDGAKAYGRYNSKNKLHATSATNAMLTEPNPLRVAALLAVLACMATGCATTGQLSDSESVASPPTLTADASTYRAVTGKKRGQQAQAKKSLARSKSSSKVAKADNRPGPVDEDLWQRIRQGFQLNVPDNARVDEARRWLGSHPEYLAKLAENAQPFIDLVTQEVEQRDLPLELALLPVIESAYNPAATSPKNAAGIWQFMPDTARVMGLKQDRWYDGRRDVLASTDAALNYLQYLSQQFDGDWHLALAAYNAGEGTIRRAIERNSRNGKPTDFWSLDLPAETKSYVPRLLAVSEVVARTDDLPGSLPALENGQKLAPIEVSTQITLATASRACDLPESEIKQYNPALRRGATGPDGPHRLLLPIDDATSCEQALAALAPEERTGWTRHLVVRGESLAKIARQNRTTVDALIASNGLDNEKVKPGTEVLIPAQPTENNPKLAAADEPSSMAKASAHQPVVRDDETLWRGSRSSRVEPTQLAAWDNMRLGDAVVSGSKLRAVKANATSRSPLLHRVRKGDTLFSIASQYNVSVEDLKRWNKLRNNHIVVGQSLSIETATKLARL